MDFSSIKGFNYQPGYAATGFEIWTSFDKDRIRAEVENGKRLFPAMNTLRIWLSFDAYLNNPVRFAQHFSEFLAILEHNQLRAMPVLFNNWHSIPDFGGVSAEQVRYWNDDSRCEVYTSYLDLIVGKHHDDPRIVIWDLCNEPFNSGQEEVFMPWLTRLYQRCKQLKAIAPITVGTPLAMKLIELLEPVSDVLTPHIYYTQHNGLSSEGEFVRAVDDVVRFAKETGKAIVAGETGWGRLNDEDRIQLLQVELEVLHTRGIGFLIHMLGHTLVADGHRETYGYVSEVGFMGCIEADGTMRNGHAFINEYLR